MKKIYIAALSKPQIENASSQEEDEKDVVADEKPAKKNLDNVSDEKPSNAKALGKSNSESNYWNILPGDLVEKILFCAVERSG